MINIIRKNGKASVLVNSIQLLGDIEFFAQTSCVSSVKLKLTKIQSEQKIHMLSFKAQDILLNLKITEYDGGISLYLAAKCNQKSMQKVHTFAPEKAITMRFAPPSDIQGLAAIYMTDSFWTLPHFGTDISALPNRTQAMMILKNSLHHCYMTKCMDNAFAEFFPQGNKIELCCGDEGGGQREISGEIMSIGISESAEKSASAALWDVTPLEKRKYPEIFEYLGWCSWNAFYHDVNANGLEEKLSEFKEKNLPFKWILIDDGWSQTKDQKLLSFSEDRKKFPDGLSGFIKKAKSEYGIKYVGAWQAFTAYWHGIEKNSEVYFDQKENLHETRTGYILPSGSGGFDFWNTWHTYLKNQGIDFVKVDVQGGFRLLSSCEKNIASDGYKLQSALDASVEINFDGNLINCMGMGKQNSHKRPKSSLMRSSGDFFPDMKDGFLRHARQNALNSLFFGHICYTDWDMWWTTHETAMQSAVMRAISGGPVYVSDKVGDTNPAELYPLIEEDGRVLRCDKPAYPTDDCVYKNCEGDILKLKNTCGDCKVLAVFCFDENGRDIPISQADITSDEPSIGYAYFAKRFFMAEAGTILHLENNGAEIINFYPIKDGKVFLGDLSKYVSSASKDKKETDISELKLEK